MHVTQSSPRSPFHYTQVILFFYFVTVFVLDASPALTNISNYIGYLAAAVFVAESAQRGNLREWFDAVPYLIPLVFLFLLMFIFFLFQPYILVRVRSFFQVLGLAFIVYVIVSRSGRTWFVESALGLSIILITFLGREALFSAVQTGERFGFSVTGGVSSEEQLNPNLYALYLNFYLLMAARFLILSLPRKRVDLFTAMRVVFVTVVCLLAIYQILFATGSRKGIVLLFYVVLCIGLIFSRGRVSLPRLSVSFAVGVCGVLLIGFLARDTFVMERLLEAYYFLTGQGTREGSIVAREALVVQGFNLWKSSPLWGHGTEAFLLKGGWGFYSHSNIIELMVSYGLLGLIFFYSMHFVFLKRCLTLFKSMNPLLRGYALWSAFGIIAMMIWDVQAVGYFSKFKISVVVMYGAVVHYYLDHFVPSVMKSKIRRSPRPVTGPMARHRPVRQPSLS